MSNYEEIVADQQFAAEAGRLVSRFPKMRFSVCDSSGEASSQSSARFETADSYLRRGPAELQMKHVACPRNHFKRNSLLQQLRPCDLVKRHLNPRMLRFSRTWRIGAARLLNATASIAS